MENEKIKKRCEVAEEFTWNLKDLFDSDDEWLKELEDLKPFTKKIAAFEGTLGENPEKLLAFFRLNDELSLRLEKLIGYAHQKSDEDTANSKYQDFSGKATSIYTQIASACSFADPEIMQIPNEKLLSFFSQCPELEPYRRSIEKLLKQADHVLSPAEEKLLSQAGEMADASENIASMLRNADMKWNDVTDSSGEKYPLTNGSFVPLLESTDQSFRKTVFEKYYEGFAAHRNTIAATLNGQFQHLKFYAEARKYPSTLEAALSHTEVPTSVYTNLIEAVHNNLDKMYRYVDLRKKMLGVSELHMYDVYTPIVQDAARKIPFSEAKETVLKALSVLGKDYTDLLIKGFSDRWIDVYENEGKRSGAYSSGNSRPHPFVLLNYKDNLDSMFTLAHEMGHALHSYHSTQTQPVSTSDYVIFVAEVASTCNEVLLMKYLLGSTTDKKEKAYLVNHFLDSFKGTVYRQTMFAEFELEMGRMCENGESLTADVLCEKYLELNKLYFGPSMISDEQIALEWARIPHFFYNYYVFQYATGFSAAVAIANRILKDGEPAVADYKRFLSSGCSQDPISLLKIAGVDMSSPDPINSALTLFGELVDELDSLNSNL